MQNGLRKAVILICVYSLYFHNYYTLPLIKSRFEGLFCSMLSHNRKECKNRHSRVRVNNFWEKSSAGINGLKLGAGFEQDRSAGELAAGQTCQRMPVREDAPIVMTA